MDDSGDKATSAADDPVQINEDGCKLDKCQETSGNPLPPSKEIRKAPKRNKSNKQVSDGVTKRPYMKLMKELESENFLALSDNKGSTFHYNKKLLKELETEDLIVLHIKEEDSSNYFAVSFLCELCAIEMVYLEECDSHINTKNHRKLKKLKGELACLSKLPQPSKHHTLALSRLLDSVFVEHGLCPVTDLPLRNEIAKTVQEIVSARHPECTVSLYGSSLTGFGLKGSDVNLDLSIPEEFKVPPMLLSILDLLQNDERFCDVTEDFGAKVPCIILKHESSGLTCELSPGNVTASNTSCLLKKYGEFDDRVRTLAVGLRHWARVCGVDCQSEGSLPGYSFALMVIQFLQETKPPVLPRWSPWHVVHDENFNVDEGFDRVNNDSTGSLWLQLFRFYCVHFNIEHWVVSVKQPMPLTRESKKWGHRRLAVEDPFSLKRNVASSLSSDKAFDYFLGCLKTSYLYFSSFSGPSENGPVTPTKEVHSNHASVTSNEKETQRTTGALELESIVVEDNEAIFQIDDVDHVAKKVQSVKLNDDGDKDNDVLDGVQPCDSELESVCITNNNTAVAVGETTTEADSNKARVNYLEPSNVAAVHIFDASVLRGKRQPIKTCCYCKHDGHVKSQCPELRKPALRKLPQVPPDFRVLLDHVCMTCRADFQFNWNEVEYREKVLRNLESYIREVYPDARLFLFGSSKNGFGFRNSDIDICMTLDAHVREDIDFVQVITTLAKLLRKHKDCGNVLAITTAKVPIVKFYLRSCKREADISLYNTLALENTRMLATYARLEDRLVTLGYTVKVFAKVCEIGDASKGSLSSYAYILMLLHYLQQQNVIPVLQTLYPDGQPPPEKNIEGWNCWFFEDLSKIKSVWNPKAKNTASVGSLWLGFLRYYTEEFDFEHDVVCCRRKKKLTKFEKMWTKHVFAIEDPFNLDHNLGAGVTRKMANYILTTFIRGRERFGVPVYDLPPEFTQQYFFDVYFLTDGCEAPADRNCRVCGKIGHFAKECPLSKSNRRAEQKKEEAEREAGGKTPENNKSSNKPFNAGPTRPRSASAPNNQSQQSDGRRRVGSHPESTPSGSEEIDGLANTARVATPPAIASLVQNEPTVHVTGVVPPLSTQRQPESIIQPLSLPSPISQTAEQVQHSQQGELKVGSESSCPEVSSESAVTSSDVTVQIATPVSSTEEAELVPKKSPCLTQSLPTPRVGAESQGTPPPLHYVQASPVVSIPVRHCHTAPVSSHPAGFYAQGSMHQASVTGSPRLLSSNIALSLPPNASSNSWHQRQPVVFNTPPENHWCSQQMRPYLGSPAQREMWLRQQHGILMSPPSPLVGLQHRSDPGSLLMSHGHRSWNVAEQPRPMIPQSPPTISRNVLWPISSSSPSQVPSSYPGASPGRGQSPPILGHQPGFPHGHPSVVGSAEHSPQLPVPHQRSPTQLVLGAHMTGEQFIDLMRTVEETSQASDETRETKIPPDDSESKNAQRIPSKELKVAKTPEERQLLSKLSKVRSLWERDAVDETNERVSEIENTNESSQLEALVASQTLSATDLQCSAHDEGLGVSDDKSGASSKVETVTVERRVTRQINATEITVSCGSTVGELKNETSVSSNTKALDEKNSGVALAEQQLQATEEKTEVNGFDAREKNGEKDDASPLAREGDVSRPKPRRRGGRNRRNKGSRKAEQEVKTTEKRAKQVAQDNKNSPQSSHHKRNYDDFKDESHKASPVAKKPKGGRWEGPRSPGGGLNDLAYERNAYNDDSPSGKKGKNGTGQNRGHEVPSGKASKFQEDRSKEAAGKASCRGCKKSRSRTKSGGYASDKDDPRRRSNSTPQKQ